MAKAYNGKGIEIGVCNGDVVKDEYEEVIFFLNGNDVFSSLGKLNDHFSRRVSLGIGEFDGIKAIDDCGSVLFSLSPN